MLRAVRLDDDVAGQLFLSAMPGRHRPFAEDCSAIVERGITSVVCLAPLDEVQRKAPEYADALARGSLAWKCHEFPISDFCVPPDSTRSELLRLIRSVAERVRAGKRVLIHCGAGIGRTGTVALGVLFALGLSSEDAERRVREAGSYPETDEQRALVEWLTSEIDET